MIALARVRKRFGRQIALDGLTLHVPKGEVIGLVGPPGSGKTTALRILATLLRPDSGSVCIEGMSVGKHRQSIRRQIGYMPEDAGFYPHLSAQEYLEFYAGIHGVTRLRRSVVACELLEVLGLGHRAQDELSVLGQSDIRRLCLARTLVHDPPVLLLDAPMSGLDPQSQVEIQDLITELGHMGKTVVVSSRLVTMVEGMSTWMGLLSDGRIVAAGPISRPAGPRSGCGSLGIRLVEEGVSNPGWSNGLSGGFPDVKAAETSEGHLHLTLAEEPTMGELASAYLRDRTTS